MNQVLYTVEAAHAALAADVSRNLRKPFDVFAKPTACGVPYAEAWAGMLTAIIVYASDMELFVQLSRVTKALGDRATREAKQRTAAATAAAAAVAAQDVDMAAGLDVPSAAHVLEAVVEKVLEKRGNATSKRRKQRQAAAAKLAAVTPSPTPHPPPTPRAQPSKPRKRLSKPTPDPISTTSPAATAAAPPVVVAAAVAPANPARPKQPRHRKPREKASPAAASPAAAPVTAPAAASGPGKSTPRKRSDFRAAHGTARSNTPAVSDAGGTKQ